MQKYNIKEFSNLILQSINELKTSESTKNRIKTDILKRISNNGDRLKYIDAKISNKFWSDNNRSFYVEIKAQIEKVSPFYMDILSSATTIKNLSTKNNYTRREISILANNYNEQRGILVQKSELSTGDVFAIIDISNAKTKYHDRIEGEFIFYYPLDTGRTLYPLNDSANVALKNILGDTATAIYMFEKECEDNYKFLDKYFMHSLNRDKDGNLIFVLKKCALYRTEKEVAETVWYLWNEEDKWINENKIIDNEDKEVLIKARSNQGFYRELLLKRLCNKCILSDIANPELLIASHIKPYVKCNKFEKTDKNNGLLLNALADKLFDRGLISFDYLGDLKFSSEIKHSDLIKIKNLIIKNNLYSIYLESKKYFDYHYENVFKK